MRPALTMLFLALLVSACAKPYALLEPQEQLNIIITHSVGKRLSELYSSDTEFFACLHGEKRGQNTTFYSISDVRYGSETNVSSVVSCDFAVVHSHPSGACGFSCQDMLSFLELAKDLNTEHSMVVCGEKKFVLVSRNSTLASEQDIIEKCGQP